MLELSLLSRISLYLLLALMGLVALIVSGWQIRVIQGRAMPNPDGSTDDWHQQKIFYGIAFADLILACPVTLLGIALALTGLSWGFYLLAWVSCWFVWTNLMTTVTSLRFERPRITLGWLIAFPFGSGLGLAFIAWFILHFDLLSTP
jgi:hypothetical protein